MNLRIEQDSDYRGNGYWNWRAWIAGDPAELKRIVVVKWLLHPSFSPSVVESRDVAKRFLLQTSGWGTFLLRAQLTASNGEDILLRHNLKLEYPLGTSRGDSKPPAPTRKQVFLSVASGDRTRIAPLKRSLEKMGVAVIDSTQVEPGAPLELATADLLSRADATIAYVSSNTPSPFVAQEVNASFGAGKPTVVFTEGNLGPIYGLPEQVQVQQFDIGNSEQITAMLKLNLDV